MGRKRTVEVGQEKCGYMIIKTKDKKSDSGRVYIDCLCRCKKCGSERWIKSGSINKHKCYRCELKQHRDSFVGTKINKLTAIRLTDVCKHSDYLWEFKCDCGKTIITHKQAVVSGTTYSCGCIKAELLKSKDNRITKSVEKSERIMPNKTNKSTGEKNICHRIRGKKESYIMAASRYGITLSKEIYSFEDAKKYKELAYEIFNESKDVDESERVLFIKNYANRVCLCFKERIKILES